MKCLYLSFRLNTEREHEHIWRTQARIGMSTWHGHIHAISVSIQRGTKVGSLAIVELCSTMGLQVNHILAGWRVGFPATTMETTSRTMGNLSSAALVRKISHQNTSPRRSEHASIGRDKSRSTVRHSARERFERPRQRILRVTHDNRHSMWQACFTNIGRGNRMTSFPAATRIQQVFKP